MTNCFKCKQEIFFDEDITTDAGKKIPCDKDQNDRLSPHDCPKNDYNKGSNGGSKFKSFNKMQPQATSAVSGLSDKQFNELKEILANLSIMNSNRLEEIHKDVKGRGIPSDMFDDVIGTLQTHSEDLRQIKIKLGIIEQT